MRGTITLKPTLLLNADYSVLTTITVKRGICLFISGKAKILKSKDNKKIHPNFDIGIPSVMVLSEYRHIPFRRIPLTRKNILLRDNYRCQYSNIKLTPLTATIDHVIPRCVPGSPGNQWTNLVACSKSINHLKGDRTPEQAGLKLIRKPYIPKMEDIIIRQKKEWADFFSAPKKNMEIEND